MQCQRKNRLAGHLEAYATTEGALLESQQKVRNYR